jgi:hypothetical protein
MKKLAIAGDYHVDWETYGPTWLFREYSDDTPSLICSDAIADV